LAADGLGPFFRALRETSQVTWEIGETGTGPGLLLLLLFLLLFLLFLLLLVVEVVWVKT
jgi:hypothetical protein